MLLEAVEKKGLTGITRPVLGEMVGGSDEKED